MPRSLKKGRSPSGDRSSSTPSSLVHHRQGPCWKFNFPRQPLQKKAVPEPLAAGSSSNSPRQPLQKKAVIEHLAAGSSSKSPRQPLQKTAVTEPLAVGSSSNSTTNSRAKEVILVDHLIFAPQPKILSYPFPFVVGRSIEEAYDGLPLCNVGDVVSVKILLQRQKEKLHGKHHYSTINQRDRGSLNPHQFVNDVVIDFRMQWLSRNCYNKTSDEVFFTSHFYSKVADGINGVRHANEWLLNKKFDIFTKRILYFPINKDKHWSLCIVTNPSKVRSLSIHDVREDNCDNPIILHFDALGFHNSSDVGNNIQKFLNYAWEQRYKNDSFMFDETNYPIICPVGKDVQLVHIV